jgi:uncharacterized protein (DUF2062 family)
MLGSFLHGRNRRCPALRTRLAGAAALAESPGGGPPLKRWIVRLRASLDGVSTERIALIVAVGLVLGVFPVFGCPTVLCAVAAIVLRLNLPALQLVNQISSPLQLLLLVPLARLGGYLVVVDSRATAWSLRTAAFQAVAGWCCVCVPLGVVLYFALKRILHRRARSAFSNRSSLARASAAGGSLPSESWAR